jgi:type IV pilus assembly protein PilO
MKTVQERFEILKHQLPTTKEEAEVLEAISQQASAAGLSFVAIKPSPPEQKTFYKEHTLELKLSGPYHGIGTFVDQLSKMPRMVTFHDINLKLEKPIG